VSRADDGHIAVVDAVRYGLGRSVARLIQHEEGVRSGEDPEDVHQARVATRRLRSDLRTFGDVLEPSWGTPLREELGWLGGLLGGVRDVDVLRDRIRFRLGEIPDEDRPVAEGLIATLIARRKEARAPLVEAMQGDRYRRLAESVVAAANDPAVLPEVASAPADGALRPALETLWKDLDGAIGRVAAEASDGSLHEARIKSKRLRYAAEALAPVFGKRARRFATAAAALQDVLGEHQDAVVAAAWLRGAAEATPSVAFVAGELVTLERHAAEAARAEWPRAWRSLSRKKLRFWV
jgi:CHAD domain-containing protein